MEIERFVWTVHAEDRLQERRLGAADVEGGNQGPPFRRQVNDGRAEWLISGRTPGGVAFEAIYDHPHGNDGSAVRIVSVWRLDS